MQIDNEPSGAVFSDERTHRLYLWRRWNKERPRVMFIGLNPSTADERLNDATVRRCIDFAARWNYGGMFMCNLFTLVSTDPRILSIEPRPVAIGADLAMCEIRRRCELAIVAWGNLITKVRNADSRVEWISGQLWPLHCLGVTKLGHPRHPLYLPKDSQLVEFGRQ